MGMPMFLDDSSMEGSMQCTGTRELALGAQCTYGEVSEAVLPGVFTLREKAVSRENRYAPGQTFVQHSTVRALVLLPQT